MPQRTRLLVLVILAVTGSVQFLVLPFFINMAQGGKVAFFSVFVLSLMLFMVLRRGEWFIPTGLLPLAGLLTAFGVSQLFSVLPVEGTVETWTLGVCVLFCLLVANIAREEASFSRLALGGLCILGFVAGLLCIYQYSHWIAFGPTNRMLIPYLLPPVGGRRVNGPYGQPNLTALLLLVSLVAFLWRYVRQPEETCGAKRNLLDDLGLLVVASAFFLTGSRSGLLAFLVVLALLLFAVKRKKIYIPVSSLVRIAVVLGCSYGLSQISFTPALAEHQVFARGEFNIDVRFVFWTASLLMFLKAPLLGVGPDHFKILLPSVLQKSHDLLGFVEFEALGYTNWSHNEYLQILAETGLLGFSCLCVFLVMLGLIARKDLAGEKPPPERFFVLLVLVPFLVQANFTWSLRHPGLLFIFFLLLGIVLSGASGWRLQSKMALKYLAAALFVLGVAGVSMVTAKEYRFRKAKQAVAADGCSAALLLDLHNDSYLQFPMLTRILPLCVDKEERLADSSRLKNLKPYYEEIAHLQGTYGQWYNLAIVCRQLGMYQEAEKALKKSLEQQPTFEKGWASLHALHIEEAARQTGRPIEDFIHEKNLSTDIHDLLFKRK